MRSAVGPVPGDATARALAFSAMTTFVRRAVAVVAIVGSATGFAACSSDSSSSASTCTALQNLAQSVRDLGNVNVASGGEQGLQDAVSSVQDAFTTAKKDASDQFGSELDALESSVKQLGDDVKAGKGSGSIADWVSTLSDDLSAINDASSNLSAKVKSELGDCDLSKTASSN